MWLNGAPPPPGKAKRETELLRDGPQGSALQRTGVRCFPSSHCQTEGEMQPQATRSNQAWVVLVIAFKAKQMYVPLPQPPHRPPRTSWLGLKCRKPSSSSGWAINCCPTLYLCLKPLHSVLFTSCYSGLNICRQNKKNTPSFCCSQYQHISWDLCRCPEAWGHT